MTNELTDTLSWSVLVDVVACQVVYFIENDTNRERKRRMLTAPSLHSAGIREMVELGEEFNAAIEDWNKARYAEGDIEREKCVSVTSWEMALAMYIWKRAQEVR